MHRGMEKMFSLLKQLIRAAFIGFKEGFLESYNLLGSFTNMFAAITIFMLLQW